MTQLYALTLQEVQLLRRVIHKVDTVSGDGVQNTPEAITLARRRGVKGAVPANPSIPIRVAILKTEVSLGFYTGQQQSWNGANYTDDSNGITFDTVAGNAGNLYEINGTTGITVATDYYFVWPVWDTSSRSCTYTFSHAEGLPAGSGQYKVLQLDASDDPHWDFPRAHS